MMSAKKAVILKPTDENIQKAALLLKQGGIVAMPTETVYGLAGSAFEAAALSKIFLTKERPTFDPLIAHVAMEHHTLADLMREQLINPHDLSDLAVKRIDKLIRTFWPGPLTLVLPKGNLVPDLATSGMETVAIRAPKHPVARKLIQAFGLSVCAPSANRFGRISPTSANDVMEELGDRIDLILDGGNCEIGIESTILQITLEGEAILLRPGVITQQMIAETIAAKVMDLKTDPKTKTPIAPGQLASHYSPNKLLKLLPSPIAQMMSPPALGGSKPEKVGLLVTFGKASEAAETFSEILELPVIAESLSEKGDWSEAAQTLFQKLRKLDASDADLLFAEPVLGSESGIAFAIADRLTRAAGPKH